MPYYHRAEVSQGDAVVTIREGETPVIVLPLFGITGTAAMAVNFLRSGAPTVQIILGLDGPPLPGVKERAVASIDLLAREGESFECVAGDLVIEVGRKLTGSGL